MMDDQRPTLAEIIDKEDTRFVSMKDGDTYLLVLPNNCLLGPGDVGHIQQDLYENRNIGLAVIYVDDVNDLKLLEFKESKDG